MEDKFFELKDYIKKELVNKTDSKFFAHDASRLKAEIEKLTTQAIKENKHLSITHGEREKLVSDIIDDILGLGPIEKLLEDPSVWEIMANGPKQVYVERDGKLELTDITFIDEDHLLYVIEKILSPLGRRVTEFEPYVDGRLRDGSRVNVIRRPISLVGPVLTIRKFSRRLLAVADLIGQGMLDKDIASFLGACVKCRLNILVSGGTSSGKTTMLNILSAFIPPDERIITIEDTAELQLPHRHKVCLETRAPSIEGKGEITIRDLLRNALHMRPDRLIIGEVRSVEALDMLQAMNIGQDGSMTTLHANSAFDALLRLETMSLISTRENITTEVVKRQIIAGIDLIIHQARFSDGSRWTMGITEILKSRETEYRLQDIFVLEKTRDVSGKVSGSLKFTGNIPTFYNRLKEEAGFTWEIFKNK